MNQTLVWYIKFKSAHILADVFFDAYILPQKTFSAILSLSSICLFTVVPIVLQKPEFRAVTIVGEEIV